MNRKNFKLEEKILHKKLANKDYLIRETSIHHQYYYSIWNKTMLGMLPKFKYKKILDIGCGTGEFYLDIKRSLRGKYLGIDLSPHMLALAKKKYKKIEVIEADVEKLPFDDNQFDLIVGRGIFHHLPNPQRGSKETRRVLKKGGLLLITEPTNNFMNKLLRKILYKYSSHFSSKHRSFSTTEFEHILHASGFKVNKIQKWGVLAFPFSFPDILPLEKFIPFPLFKLLVRIDLVLIRIPIIRSLSWHMMVLAEK